MSIHTVIDFSATDLRDIGIKQSINHANQIHEKWSELAYQSFTQSNKLFRFRWNGMLQENMKDKEERIHPTQKPVQLYKWLLKNYAKPEFKIIDTHLGSGSSAIAAYDFGIAEFVGCEIDKEYYDAAVKRFEIHKMQRKLF